MTMLSDNTCLSERTRVLDGKAGTPVTGTDLEGTWTKYADPTLGARRLLAILGVTGEFTDAETLTFRIEKATDSGGTGKATVKEIVRAAHATENDNIMLEIDAHPNDLGVTFTHVRIVAIASAGAGGLVWMALLGGDLRNTPEGDDDSGDSTGLVDILRGATGS